MNWEQQWQSLCQTIRTSGKRMYRNYPDLRETIERDVEEFCSQPELKSFDDLLRCSQQQTTLRARWEFMTSSARRRRMMLALAAPGGGKAGSDKTST